MFPIRNARGSLIGFGGRIIGKGEPKYLNSPETPLFSKGQELYGLWEARQAIRQEGQVIVVEGYMDVVGLAQQGIANAVATLGTATTPDHVKKLLRASDKVIFSFDGDGAGRRAAWRAPCRPACRCCATTSRSASFSCRPSTIPIPMCANSALRRSGPAWAKPSPCRDSCWTSWPRATTWTRPKGGRAVCTRPSRCWPRSWNARCASRSSARWQVGPAHAGRNGPGAGAAAGQTIRRAGGCQGAAGRRRPTGSSGSDTGFVDGAMTSPAMTFTTFRRKSPITPITGIFTAPMASPPVRQAVSRAASVARNGSPGATGKARATGRARALERPARGRRRRFRRPPHHASLAKRLLGLLLAHPELVDSMGDQQLEVIDHGPI